MDKDTLFIEWNPSDRDENWTITSVGPSSIQPVSWSESGLHVISVYAMDNDLEKSATKTATVNIINRVPTIEPIGDEEDSQLGDFIEDKNALLPLDNAIQGNLKETTTRVLASLTPREERVLRMRFGIGVNTDHTLEEVGQQFSVTRERIRQIEAKALRKLKHPSRSRKLRSFLDQ